MENHLLISGRIKLSWVWHNARRLFSWTVSCLFHFMKRPYHQDVPAIGYKVPHANMLLRVRDTCFDGLYTVLLNSYVEFSGEALIPSTGQMLFFLRRLFRRLDEYLDAAWLKSGSLPELDELLEAPLIKMHLKTLEQYVQCFDRAEPIMAYLSKAFIDFYAPYIQSFTKAKKDGMFEDILMAAH